MVTPDALRALMQHLQSLVELRPDGTISFAVPDREELVATPLDPAAVDGLLAAPWLDEMVTDVVETPEFCEPDADPDEVLRWARDVISEAIRKRYTI